MKTSTEVVASSPAEPYIRALLTFSPGQSPQVSPNLHSSTHALARGCARLMEDDPRSAAAAFKKARRSLDQLENVRPDSYETTLARTHVRLLRHTATIVTNYDRPDLIAEGKQGMQEETVGGIKRAHRLFGRQYPDANKGDGRLPVNNIALRSLNYLTTLALINRRPESSAIGVLLPTIGRYAVKEMNCILVGEDTPDRAGVHRLSVQPGCGSICEQPLKRADQSPSRIGLEDTRIVYAHCDLGGSLPKPHPHSFMPLADLLVQEVNGSVSAEQTTTLDEASSALVQNLIRTTS